MHKGALLVLAAVAALAPMLLAGCDGGPPAGDSVVEPESESATATASVRVLEGIVTSTATPTEVPLPTASGDAAMPTRALPIDDYVTATPVSARMDQGAVATPFTFALEPPRDEGTVVLTSNRDWILDPLVGFPHTKFPLGEVYSGLTGFDGTLAGNVVPELARSWRVSADGTRYTFVLRDALRFSDGSVLTAQDFKWSWERALKPSYLTETAREVFGAVRGASEMMSREADSLAGVVAVDEQTLSVELVRPQAHFLEMMALPVAAVLKRENVENWGTVNWLELPMKWQHGIDEELLKFDEFPVGTGPFRIRFDHPIAGVFLEANPHYHRQRDAVREIRLLGGLTREDGDGYVHHHRSDVADCCFAVPKNRDVDFVPSSTDDLEDESDVDLHVDFSHSRDFVRPADAAWLAFNSAVPPFDDLEFRRALMASIRLPEEDEGLIIGWTVPVTGLVPPGTVGGGRALVDLAPDEAAARRHLAASAYGAGRLPKGLEFHKDDSLDDYELFERLSRYWRSWLGLSFRDTSDRYYASLSAHNWRLAQGTLQMRYVHVKPRYPDPCSVLCRIPELFGPKAQSAETELLRSMLEDAAATADPPARYAKYLAIEEHVLDRALVVPLIWDDGSDLLRVQPWISGYKLPAYGGSQYEDVVVDTTHPEYPAGR